MLKAKSSRARYSWFKSEINFTLKDILAGVLREVMYMGVLTIILLVMTKLV